MNKARTQEITGGITQTSKMPCKSYSLPTIACKTGFLMSEIAGSICASCYAQKGFYAMYAGKIEPAQHARLTAIECAIENAEYRQAWIAAMQTLIGTDQYFRFHDSGDIQSVEHLELYAELARSMPYCQFWIPTREYGIVAAFSAQFDLPDNMIIRLSAMFVNKPVVVPASLRNVPGIAASNVHTENAIGTACNAPKQSGKCLDCRACWDRTIFSISYKSH
jgi:hypothetical protein